VPSFTHQFPHSDERRVSRPGYPVRARPVSQSCDEGVYSMFGGQITGASMNPARSLGPALY